MKTSELRQAIRNLGFDFKETDEYILIGGIFRVFKKIKRINFLEDGVYGYQRMQLLKLAIEYTETPIEEREEEKKYYFQLYEGFERPICKRFLKLDVSSGLFYFCDGHENRGRFKGELTQKEIDDFPPEIKGAIECGFFKKVEIGE